MNTFDHDDLMHKIESLSGSPPPKKILSWEQIPSVAALPEGCVEWIVEGMIPAGAVTLMAGESGTYKTFLAHCLARGVAEGSAFLGRKCVARKVLYLDRENPPALVRERATLLRLPATDTLKIWGAWLDDPPPLLGDPRLLEYAAQHAPLIVFVSFKCFKNRLAPEFALTLRPELATSGDFAVVDMPGDSAAKDVTLLRDTIAAKPGIVQKDLITQTGLARERAVRLLREHEGKLWHIERGRGRMMQYFLNGREPGDDSMGLPFQDDESSIN